MKPQPLKLQLERSLMPDIADKFPALSALSFDALNQRRRDLLGTAKTFDELALDSLLELSAISTLLRRKSSGPPRDAKTPPPPKSILDLMA